MITVKVINQSSGNPASGKRVVLGFDGVFSGGNSSSEYTDSNGEAHFNNENGTGQVFVDGRTEYRGKLAGRIIIYI